jgi:hypothetical protein
MTKDTKDGIKGIGDISDRLEHGMSHPEDVEEAVAHIDPVLFEGLEVKDKEILKASIYDFENFCMYVLPCSYEKESLFKFELNWHHHIWCRDIQSKARVCEIGPRYSLKSTICGHAQTMWRMLRFNFGMYVSYRDDLAAHHLSIIRGLISENRFFTKFKDLNKQSVKSLHYQLGERRIEVLGAGIFTAVRGLHPAFVILDDILPDSTEGLATPSELQRIEKTYNGAHASLPVKGGSLTIVGTPQDPRDILHSVKKRKGYLWRKLPAEDGCVFDIGASDYVDFVMAGVDAGKIGVNAVNRFTDVEVEGESIATGWRYDCLWANYDKAWLHEQRDAIKAKAYSREFMCQPASLSDSYFKVGDIEGIIDKSLPRCTMEYPYIRSNPDEVIIAGMDIGKKQHPSHLSVFRKEGETKIQICSIYLEDMDYTAQVEYVNRMIEVFGIDSLYWDNTRGELEDRGLEPTICKPVVFSVRDSKTTDARGKLKMATALEGEVNHRHVRLLDDDRQKSQIIQVRNDLKSASTEEGHGDAFFSWMLAVAAEIDARKTAQARTVGDVQQIFGKTRVEAKAVLDKAQMNQRWQYGKEADALAEIYKDSTVVADWYNKKKSQRVAVDEPENGPVAAPNMARP